MKERSEITLPGRKTGLFCDAVKYGDLLFTSGTVARNLNGEVVAPQDTVAQTKYIFQKLKEVLELCGSSPQQVLKMTIFLRNMNDRLKINALRQEFFADSKPASTVVEVSKLAHEDLMVEIELVSSVKE